MAGHKKRGVKKVDKTARKKSADKNIWQLSLFLAG